jgi:alkanesulfonate monooxygenase SsuD/methylene tetrahydromethanopterin reductase-like flavin-dependent oxidoreductase (luciferase family)
MEFGVLHFFEHPAGSKTEHRVFNEQLDTLRAAEKMDFDYIWAPEHHFTEYGFCASPMLMLAAMASVTKRVRLGSAVVVLPFNDPVRVAEEGAMVDLMSDGRLDLGVGRGFQRRRSPPHILPAIRSSRSATPSVPRFRACSPTPALLRRFLTI